jgi:hypothetical protein
MSPALFLLLAAFARIDLVDENFEIPASDWRYVPHAVTDDPAIVDCLFQANRPDAWRLGRDHDEAAATPVGPRGLLRITVHDPGTYLAIENRGRQPAGVRLRVYLEQPNVRYLSNSRRLAVILISFSVFFAIATFSARRLLNTWPRH